MTAAENGRTLIRYKLSYPAADFVFDVATYSVSGVVGGLRPLRNVLRMRPLTSVADSVESFFNDLNIPHITYYRTRQTDEQWERRLQEIQQGEYDQLITMLDGKEVKVKKLQKGDNKESEKSGQPENVKIRLTVDWSVRPEVLRRFGMSPEQLIGKIVGMYDANWNALVASASPQIVSREIVRDGPT